ncbi:hypothetical protein AB205_0089270, partial [Aquarana catesbeiana]
SYLPALRSGFAKSSPDPPLLGSLFCAPGPSLQLSAPTASSLLWGHPSQVTALCVHSDTESPFAPFSPHWPTDFALLDLEGAQTVLRITVLGIWDYIENKVEFEIRQLRAHLAQQDLDLVAERERALKLPHDFQNKSDRFKVMANRDSDEEATENITELAHGE